MIYPRMRRNWWACPRCDTQQEPERRACDERTCIARGAPHTHHRCPACGFRWIKMRDAGAGPTVTRRSA